MQTKKRRRRIERIKKFIRFLLFLKHNFRRGVIVLGCLLFLSFAGYFSIRYAEAAEDKENADIVLQMPEVEPVSVKFLGEKDVLNSNLSEDMTYHDEQLGKLPEEMNTSEEIEEAEKNAASHKIDEPIYLSDVYAEKDSIVIFKSFYPEASGYTWEMYDAKGQQWVKIPDEDIICRNDELQREVSVFITSAENEHDGLMIRCTTLFDTKEPVIDIASLHVLNKNIQDISIDDDITVESGQYISASDIPVQVTYQDGSAEVIKGLNGIYFLDTEESTEESTSVSGNLIETVTTINKAYEYTWAEAKEKEMTIRYKSADESVDTSFHLIGKDVSAPVISQLTISDFVVSNIDTSVPVEVVIQAEDDTTPYDKLQYAFLPDGEEPEEDAWYDRASFDVDITQNGTWLAYCKDESGNIATKETEIIAVDNKAPFISLQLEKDEDIWCQANCIIVKATDALPVEYCYSCIETGEESGWMKQNKKEITQNGTWKVMVRDEAGNIAEQEIVVSNIDKQPPVIQEIKVKE
ncbi:MAG: hypothetical protein NC231_12400 [Bacillus sp. (in: Bacteria)]|nr:hypothetical protein [Bacillus sp. (in: firmicutes)]MCM1427856.1 hypothetical protein [Eubacterium sp.]